MHGVLGSVVLGQSLSGLLGKALETLDDGIAGRLASSLIRIRYRFLRSTSESRATRLSGYQDVAFPLAEAGPVLHG